MLDGLIGYFDLNREAHAIQPSAVAATPGTGGPGVPAWAQYLALIAGIIIQPSFAAYQQTHRWTWANGIGWLLFSVIVGVIIFPAVYRKTFDDTDPKLVSIAPIFTAGLGWQTLLATAVAAVSTKPA
jgi:hypothetical protein